MRAVSLFSGIGGMDLGLEQAGIHIVMQCEFDDWRREVLKERFGDKVIVKDVCEIYYGESEGGSAPRGFYTVTQTRRKTWTGISGNIDLLFGGFPCQDLSVAGRRKGLAGERSSLFFEFARIADESIGNGGFVLIENVPGIFSSNEGKDFQLILKTLSQCGFNDIAWRTLNSQYFGVPQRRRRVFILARRSSGRSCGEILLKSQGSFGNSYESQKKKTSNSPISLSGVGDGGADVKDFQSGRITPALITRAGNVQDDQQTMQLINELKTEIIGVRRLTPIECERLQGFPDNFSLVGNAKDTKRYAAIGDAVTVPVAKWIGEKLMKEFML